MNKIYEIEDDLNWIGKVMSIMLLFMVSSIMIITLLRFLHIEDFYRSVIALSFGLVLSFYIVEKHLHIPTFLPTISPSRNETT